MNENQKTYINAIYYFGAGYCLLPLGMIALNYLTGAEFVMGKRIIIAGLLALIGAYMLIEVYNRLKEKNNDPS